MWLSSQRTSRRPRLVLGLGVVVLGISNTSCRPYYCFLLHVTVYRTARELGKPLRFFSRSRTVARYPTYYTHGSSPAHAQSLVFNKESTLLSWTRDDARILRLARTPLGRTAAEAIWPHDGSSASRATRDFLAWSVVLQVFFIHLILIVNQVLTGCPFRRAHW